jgi:hypothetical protein
MTTPNDLRQRLAELPPDEFAEVSAEKIMQMVREESQSSRKGKRNFLAIKLKTHGYCFDREEANAR